MASTLSLSYADIEDLLDGYSLSDKSAEVLTCIEEFEAVFSGLLSREGYVLSELATTGNGYKQARLWVKMRVAAEVGRRFTHQDPELSRQRDKLADKIESALHASPESFDGSWSPDSQRGSFRTDRTLESIPPGSANRRRRPRWGEEGF